eukprot:3582762-Prymnesium_polylepis.1
MLVRCAGFRRIRSYFVAPGAVRAGRRAGRSGDPRGVSVWVNAIVPSCGESCGVTRRRSIPSSVGHGSGNTRSVERERSWKAVSVTGTHPGIKSTGLVA